MLIIFLKYLQRLKMKKLFRILALVFLLQTSVTINCEETKQNPKSTTKAVIYYTTAQILTFVTWLLKGTSIYQMSKN